MNSPNLLPYAMDFCSYLLQDLPQKKLHSIRTIIFFGSGARGEAGRQSDPDIFLEVEGPTKELERQLDRITDNFYRSIKWTRYWKLLGITQELSLTVGNLKEWKNLLPALLTDGKVLFGKYFSTNAQGKGKILFSWENLHSQKQRTNLYRSLFGYKDKGKQYPGFLERYHGQRLSKGSILVPVEHGQLFRSLFTTLKVPVREKTLLEV